MNADYTPWVKAMELAKTVAATEHQSVVVYHRLCDGQWFVCTAGEQPPTGRIVKYAVHADSVSPGKGAKPARKVAEKPPPRFARKGTADVPVRELAVAKT